MDSNKGQNIESYKTKGYNLLKPDVSIDLHNSLREISGLDIIDDKKFVAIQDEAGKFYFLDETFQIIDKKEFYVDGDYEALSFVNDRYYIARSNGFLFRYDPSKKKKKRLKKYSTGLSRRNDVEGLLVSPDEQFAFLVCKEDAHILEEEEGVLKDKRAIYQFNLETKKLNKKPIALIQKGVEEIKPTAIRYHPIDKTYWVLTSSPNKIVVLDTLFKEIGRTPLTDELRQPEAMAIAKDGTVYIASEAAGALPTVSVFKRKE